jgi:hypothetical protein
MRRHRVYHLASDNGDTLVTSVSLQIEKRAVPSSEGLRTPDDARFLFFYLLPFLVLKLVLLRSWGNAAQ